MNKQSVTLGFCIIVGVASIISWSHYSFGTNPLLSAVIPSVCIILYLLLNWTCVGSTKIQVADNTYFIGFLFTLMSLVVSMASLDKTTFDFNSVLSNAGTAFITTFVGSVLRLLFIQSAINVKESQQQAEDALLATTMKYNLALAESSQELLKGQQDRMHELKAVFQTSIDAMQGNVATLQDTFLSSASAFQETAISTSTKIKETLGNMVIPENILADQLAPSLHKMAQTIHDIDSMLQRSARSTVEFSNNVESNVDYSHEKLAGLVKGVGEALDSFSNKIKEIGDPMANLSNNLVTADRKVQQISLRSVTIPENVLSAQLAPALQQMAQTVANINTSLQKSTRSSVEFSSNVESSVKNSQEKLCRLAKNADRAFDSVSSKIKEIETPIDNLSHQLVLVGSKVQRVSPGVRKLRSRVTKRLSNKVVNI